MSADHDIGSGAVGEKVTLLSIAAAMMVVAIHVGGNAATRGSLVWWWEQIGHYGVFCAAVPFFFVCSGFFLGRHCDEEGWWSRGCLKRVRSLLVPYLIWSAVFAALGIGAVVAVNLIHGRDLFLHCPWQNDRLLSLVFVPLVLAGAWTLLPVVKMPAWISRLSFPLYLLHVPVMFVGGMFFTWHTEMMLGWWAKYVFALVGSIFVCWVMKRFFPRVALVAFGGRL